MPNSWTSEQVIALAPDESSAKAGRGLAAVSNWVSTGCDEQAVWGECKGSGKNPYQVTIDLSEPAFKCSCPSRKFPCKHGLGLFLLYAVGQIKPGAQAQFCAEWLEKRAIRRKSAKKTTRKSCRKSWLSVKRRKQNAQRNAKPKSPQVFKNWNSGSKI